MTPDATTPKGLSDAMYIIHEMATPEAMDRLIAGARSRGIDLEGTHLTPSDVAALQRRQIVLPNDDLDIEDQFTTHTYTLHDGRVVYSKGNDHIIDAVRCAVLAREQENMGHGAEQAVSLMPLVTAAVFV